VLRAQSSKWIAVALCACLAFARPVAAQGAPDPAEPAGYGELISQALEERNAGRFEEAQVLFARAHALFPNARTLRALGMVEFELRHYRASAQYLEQALAAQVRPLDATLRTSVLELVARAQVYLGKLALNVEPRDASVELDGAAVALDTAQPLQVDFGEHTLEVSAPGYVPEERTVNVRAGETKTLRIRLNATPSAAVADASPAIAPSGSDASPTPASHRGPGALPWVLVGAGGAMLAGGGVLLVLAQNDIHDVEHPRANTRWSDVSDAYDTSPLKSGIGFALLGVGAMGVTAGLIWALGGDDREHARAGHVQLAVGPRHAVLRGAF
jgi:hypothetical protein